MDSHLQNTLSLLQSALESTADGILVVNSTGKIVLFNQRFAKMWSIPQSILDARDDELALKHVLGQLKDPNQFLAKVKELYSRPETEDFDVLCFKDGRMFERYSRPHYLDGKPVGRVWSFRDVTERRKAEEELRKAQIQMLEAEKKAVIQLASGVGHELRNPLAAIKNALYYVRHALKESGKIDATLLQFLDLAEIEVKNAGNIIGNLIAYSKADDLEPQPIDVNQILIELLRAVDKPQSVKVVENYVKDLPRTPGDPTKLTQVFLHLIFNALQSMPHGGELEVSTRAERTGSAAFVLAQFKDSGSGIDSQDLGRVFEPLFTTKAKGAGLGLAICWEIVKSHGGEILVQSERGKGSLFTVKLPCTN